MGVLRISLFGGVHVRHDRDASEGAGRDIKLTRRVQSVLAYLLLHRQKVHPREELLEAHWPEMEEGRARACLNTVLWRLRSALEPDGIDRGTYLLTTPLGELSFNWESDYWLDAQIFEEAQRHLLSRPVGELGALDAQRLESALDLYVGDLVPGVYEDWALLARERLRSLYIDGLSRLLQHCKLCGDHERGLDCARRILELDVLREEVHRDMMSLYADRGQRVRAIQQYELCRQTLRAELDVAPMQETTELYAQILAADRSPTPPCPAHAMSDSLKMAMEQFETAMSAFKQAQAALQKALPDMERRAGHPEGRER